MKKMKKAILLMVILVCAALMLLASGCSNKQKEVKEQNAVSVKVMKTARSTIEDVANFTGQIEAKDEVKIVGKISGRVKEVNFDIGDYVNQGDVLVVLETDELNDQLSQAEAALASAKANLSASESGLAQQLEQARASLEQAEANYTNVKADYERMKALYEADAISKQAFDGAELKYSVAKSQYESAKEQYSLVKQSLPKNIDALKAQVAQAQAAVDLIKTNIANSVIKAPVSGMISSKQIQPGEMCQAGSTLGAVVNIDKVKVVINVPAEDVNRLKDGQEATVSVDALGNDGNFKSKISIVSPASGSSRLFQVKIEIENNDHRLKPGMFASVNVVRGVRENVITIPKDAVVIKKQGNAVYVVKAGKAEERLVKIGVTSKDMVEVAEGLNEGEEVVTSGQNMLAEGTAVKIIR
ncbi:MAG TPA: efflux RND transporter periplasmic adaptor subunit [Thermoanaerobacterales bacterium]|nr:efflux RND transporter periplasmic adaptor subunit [Thermoanaerobacterales bacterium]